MSIATESATESVPKVIFPTHLDLPFTDNKPVDNFYQPEQAALLTGCLIPHFENEHPDGKFLIGSNSGIYWRTTNPPDNGCKAPDWFFVPGVPRLLDGQLRLSYVMWVEAVTPAVVMEFVSGNGAEEHDATPFSGKFWVYEQGIHADYYVIWDRRREKLEVFNLNNRRYVPVAADERGRVPLAALNIAIGAWDGTYHTESGVWLRAWDLEGNLIPTAEERAELANEAAENERMRNRAERRRTREEKQRADQEKQRADEAQKAADQEKQRTEQEKQRADQEKQRADGLLARLRALGIDPDKA